LKIVIIGAGRIGGNCARQAIKAGHEVVLTYTRNPERLSALAAKLGASAEPDVGAAVLEAELAVLSVPWDAIDDAVARAGSLAGKVVVDTTNQYGRISLPPEGTTAASHNAARIPGARYTKSFNTLTSRFQAEAAGRSGDERAVQWLAGDDDGAKAVVADLITAMGYFPADLGGTATCYVMEAPRRPGAVYGEEYRVPDAQAVIDAVAASRPIPPTPSY
jgi:8-hydroxy-5-deazaflavin:NADPH oxidoreductase